MGSFDISIAQKVAVAVALPVASFLLYFLLKKSNEEEEEPTPKLVTSRQTLIEVKVPRSAAGAIIGPKGARIKEVQENTGARIQFKDDVGNDNKERTVVIRGQVEAAQRAEMIIRHMIAEIPPIVKDSINVPERAIGRIIGRGGETIRSLSRSSKCKINVPQEQRLGGIQRIILEGSPAAIASAKTLIEEKVREEEAFKARVAVNASNRQERGPRRREGGTETTYQEALQLQQPEDENWESQPKSQPAQAGSVIDATPLATPKTPGVAKWGNPRDYLELYVSAVEHPGHFWVQVISSTRLDELSEDMTRFYSHMNEKEATTVGEIQVGDLLAAPFPFDEQWYRVRVTEVADDKVDAYYVDFGDSYWVEKSQLKSLRSDFLRLPFQAIEVCLANVKPNGETWSEEANILFEELTHMAKWKVLNARTVSYTKTDDGESMPCLEVIDTNGPKDVNVAKVLIEKGHAVYVQEKETDKGSDVAANIQIDDSITSEEISIEIENKLTSHVDSSSSSYCRKRTPHRNSEQLIESVKGKEDLVTEKDLIDTVGRQSAFSCCVDTSTGVEKKVPFDDTSPCIHVEPFDQRLLQATFLEDDFVNDLDVFYDAKEDQVNEIYECEMNANLLSDSNEHATVKMEGVNDLQEGEMAPNSVKKESDNKHSVLSETSIQLIQPKCENSERNTVLDKAKLLVSETKGLLSIRPQTLDIDTQEDIQLLQREIAAKQLYQSSLSRKDEYFEGLSESCRPSAGQDSPISDMCDVTDSSICNMKSLLSVVCMEIPHIENLDTKDGVYAPESVSSVHSRSLESTNSRLSTDSICLSAVDESINHRYKYGNKEDISKNDDSGNCLSLDKCHVVSDIRTQGFLGESCEHFSISHAEVTEAGAKVGYEGRDSSSAADYNQKFESDQLLPFDEGSSHAKTAECQTPILYYDEKHVESEGAIVHKCISETEDIGNIGSSVCSAEDLHVSLSTLGVSNSPTTVDIAHPMVNSASLLVIARQCQDETAANVGPLSEEMCPSQTRHKHATVPDQPVPKTREEIVEADVTLMREFLSEDCSDYSECTSADDISTTDTIETTNPNIRLRRDEGDNLTFTEKKEVCHAQDLYLSIAELSSIPVYEDNSLKEMIFPEADRSHWSEVFINRQFAYVEKKPDILKENVIGEACTEGTHLPKAEQNSVSVQEALQMTEAEVPSFQDNTSNHSGQTCELDGRKEVELVKEDTEIIVENSLLHTDCPDIKTNDGNCEQGNTPMPSNSELQGLQLKVELGIQCQQYEIPSSFSESQNMPIQKKEGEQSNTGLSTDNALVEICPRDLAMSLRLESREERCKSAHPTDKSEVDTSDAHTRKDRVLSTDEETFIPGYDRQHFKEQVISSPRELGDIHLRDIPASLDPVPSPDCDREVFNEESSEIDFPGTCPNEQLNDVNYPPGDKQIFESQNLELGKSEILRPQTEDHQPEVSASVTGSSKRTVDCTGDNGSISTDNLSADSAGVAIHTSQGEEQNLSNKVKIPGSRDLSGTEPSSSPENENLHVNRERVILFQQTNDEHGLDQGHLSDEVAVGTGESTHMSVQKQYHMLDVDILFSENHPESGFDVNAEEPGIVFTREDLAVNCDDDIVHSPDDAVSVAVCKIPVSDKTSNLDQDEEHRRSITDTCDSDVLGETNSPKAISIPEDESQCMKEQELKSETAELCGKKTEESNTAITLSVSCGCTPEPLPSCAMSIECSDTPVLETMARVDQDEGYNLSVLDISDSYSQSIPACERLHTTEQIDSPQEVESEPCSQQSPVLLAPSSEENNLSSEANVYEPSTLAEKDMVLVPGNADYALLDKTNTDANVPVECFSGAVEYVTCESDDLMFPSTAPQNINIEQNEDQVPGMQPQECEKSSTSAETSIKSSQDPQDVQWEGICCTKVSSVGMAYSDSALLPDSEVQTTPLCITSTLDVMAVDTTDCNVHSTADTMSTEPFELPVSDTNKYVQEGEECGLPTTDTMESFGLEVSATAEQSQHSEDQVVPPKEFESEQFSHMPFNFEVQIELPSVYHEAVQPKGLDLGDNVVNKSSITSSHELNDPETQCIEDSLRVHEEFDVPVAQPQCVSEILAAEPKDMPQIADSLSEPLVELRTPGQLEYAGASLHVLGSTETSCSPECSNCADLHSDQTERLLQIKGTERYETGNDKPLVSEKPAKKDETTIQCLSEAELNKEPAFSSTKQHTASTVCENLSISNAALSSRQCEVMQTLVAVSSTGQLQDTIPIQTESSMEELHFQAGCTRINEFAVSDDTRASLESLSSQMHGIEESQEEIPKGSIIQTYDTDASDCRYEAFNQNSALEEQNDSLYLQHQKGKAKIDKTLAESKLDTEPSNISENDESVSEVCGIPVDTTERSSVAEHKPCLQEMDVRRKSLQSSITGSPENIEPLLIDNQECTSNIHQQDRHDHRKSEQITETVIKIDETEINFDDNTDGNSGITQKSATPSKLSSEPESRSFMKRDGHLVAESVDQDSDSCDGELYKLKACEDAELIEVTLCSMWETEPQILKTEDQCGAQEMFVQNVDSGESVEDSMSERTVVSLSFCSDVKGVQQRPEAENNRLDDEKTIDNTQELLVNCNMEQAPNIPVSQKDITGLPCVEDENMVHRGKYQIQQLGAEFGKCSEPSEDVTQELGIITDTLTLTETAEESLDEHRFQKPTIQMSGYLGRVGTMFSTDAFRSPDIDSAYESPTQPAYIKISNVVDKTVNEPEGPNLPFGDTHQQQSESHVISSVKETLLLKEKPENIQSENVNDEYKSVITPLGHSEEEFPVHSSREHRKDQFGDDDDVEITTGNQQHQERCASDQLEESNCSVDEDNRIPSLVGMKMYNHLLEVITNDGSESVDSGLQLQDHLPSDDSKHDAIKEWLMVQASPVLDNSSSVWSEGSNTSSCRELIDACQGEECLEIDVPCCMESSVDEEQDMDKIPYTEGFIPNTSAGESGAFDSFYTSGKLPAKDRKSELTSFRLHSSLEDEDSRNPELVSSNYDKGKLTTALKGCQDSLADAFFKSEPLYADATARKEVADRLVGHLAPQYAPSFRRCASTGDIETEKQTAFSAIESWSEDEYTRGRRHYAYDDQYRMEYDDDSSSMDSLEEATYPAASAMRHRSPSRGYTTTTAAAGQLRQCSRGETRHCSLYDEFQDMLEEFYGHASLVSVESATATTSTSYASALEDLPSDDFDQVMTDSLEELTAEDIGATYPDILYLPSSRSSISQDSLNDIDDISSSNGGGEEICETNSSFTDDSIEDAYDTDDGGPRVIYGTQLEQTLFEANITPTVEVAAPFPASPTTPTHLQGSKDAPSFSHTEQSARLPTDPGQNVS